MTVQILDKNLVITIPMAQPLKPSKSGKSLTVASTYGNVRTTAIVNGKPLTVGLNCYIPAA